MPAPFLLCYVNDNIPLVYSFEMESLFSHVAPIAEQYSGENTRNDPKFSDRYVWANGADPDQTAPRGAV